MNETHHINYPPLLYVLPTGHIGGMERAMVPVIQRHTRFSPSVFLLQDGPVREMLQEAKVPVTLATPFRMRNVFGARKAIQECTALTKEIDASLVVTSMAYAHLIGGRAAQAAHLPSCLFQHGPVGGIFEYLSRTIVPSGVIANSQYVLQQHKRIWPPSPHSLVVDPMVQSLSPAAPVPSPPNSPSHWIGMLGRISPEKGILEAVSSLRPLLGRYPDWGLMVVGDLNTEVGAKLSKIAQVQGASRQLWLAGPQNDVSPFVARCEVILNSSVRPEGFGLSLAEGATAGKTLVGPNEGGVCEWMEDGLNGLLFDPRNVLSLRTCIERLINDPPLRARLGEQARKIASKRFDRERVMTRIEDFLKTLRKGDV